MTDINTTEPLERLASKIEEHAKQSEDHVLIAAKLVCEARHRVEDGEAGNTTWYEWGRRNIKLSPSRLYELQCIAEADDPKKELERLRKLTRERVKNHREMKAAKEQKQEVERRELIAWATKAPIEEVRSLLRLTAGNDNAAGSIEERPGPADEQAA